MTSRFRGPAAMKDGPKETTFAKDHFHLEPDVHAGKSLRNGSRDNHYHFGMNERIDRNGHDSQEHPGATDPDALYQRSKEQFASWDIKDIAQENRSKRSKKSQDDRQDNSRLTNGKSKIDNGRSDKQSKDLQDKRSDSRDEGYVGSLTREDRSNFDKEYVSSRSRKKEPWEEKKKSRSIRIDKGGEDKSGSRSPVDRRDLLLREIENLTVENGSSPERRIRAMIERFKTREESKKSRMESRSSPSKGKEEQEKTKSGRTDPPDDRADRSRIQWNDHPEDRKSKTRLTDDRTDRRSRSREKEEPRDIEHESRKNDSLRKRHDARGKGSIDRSTDRRRTEEVIFHDKEDESKRNDSLRFRSLERDDSRRHEDGRKRSDSARRRSREIGDDRPHGRDSSRRRSYVLDGSPEDFDVRIQRYERAEPRRDHDLTRKSSYRETEPSRKDSFKDHDRDSPKKSFFKVVDSPRKNSPSDREPGLLRKTSFKEQDNDTRRKNSFKSHSDASHKYFTKDGDSDLSRKNSFKEQAAEVGRRISFKSQISFKNQDDQLPRRSSPKSHAAARISFKEDDDVDRKYATRSQDHKKPDDDVSRKNSLKEQTVEFGSVSYKEPETFGRKNSREEARTRSPQSRYVEFGGTFYKSDEDEDYPDSLGRRSPRGQLSSRSRGREAIDKRSNRHSRALTPPRYTELDLQEETKNPKTFCSKSWHESNKLFAVKYLRDNSKIRNDPEDRPDPDRTSPERIFSIQTLDEPIRTADSFSHDIDDRFVKPKPEDSRQDRGQDDDRFDRHVKSDDCRPERVVKLEESRFDRASQSPDDSRDRQTKFGSERRARLDSGLNRGRETSPRFSTSHERNGTTVIRIRSGAEEPAVERIERMEKIDKIDKNEKRRRRRPHETHSGRRRRYSAEEGVEAELNDEADEEDEEEVVAEVEDNDEDDEEEHRRRSRRADFANSLVRSRQRGPGPTPSRRLWNYREGGALITDIEDGQPCLQCGETCPGFSAHTWRKNCTSCKCPREAHDVCHEEWVSVRSRLGLKGDEQSGPIGFDPRKRGLAWAPPGLPPDKVAEYFAMLPEINVPRLGTPGERHRDRQLAIQLPKQDLARAYCRHLDPQHATSADDFMAARNEIALDIGSVQEVVERDVDCGACLARLEPGSLAISASKLGLMFHPTCFCCNECNELLVDLAYCVHDDALFCERHYAEQLKPRCAACDEDRSTMGLLLSVLVGCVGVLELLACLKHASAGMLITINPPTPCLSYHDQTIETQSTHDSLCNFSHSSDVKLPRSAKHKLENLHEYSLRVRSELRSLDKNFDSTLSQWSSRDLSSRLDSRPDSRLSADFNLLVEDTEHWDQDDLEREEYDEFDEGAVVAREEYSGADLGLLPPEADRYVRIPTPIPFGLEDELSRSASSSDLGMSFDNDSGNEAPTTRFFDDLPVITGPDEGYTENGSVEGLVRPIPKRPTHSVEISEIEDVPSESQKGLFTEPRSILKQRSVAYENVPYEVEEAGPQDVTDSGLEAAGSNIGHSQRKQKSSKSSTTILRKPTRLKSKNAEISKSAENLSEKKSKRHREPERRKSDIVQGARANVKDESTNTSPLNSPILSRSESKRSVSVEVQTSFEEKLSDDEVFTELESTVVGLSESKRDMTARERSGRKSFKSKRFRSTSREDSSDDSRNTKNATASVERSRESRSLRISQFEEADTSDYDMIKDVIGQESTTTTRRESRNAWKRGSSRSKSSVEEDEEYVDADDGAGPIQYSIPDPKENEAFWLIFSGEYTKAMNKDWHSGHFCCWQCDESLTGQRYVLRDEHPYCIKCYESVFANGCEECNKIIGIDSKDLSYKDKHWHEACFLCNRCRVSLVDKQFGSKVDKIYCGNCYDAQFASRCDGCGEIFRAGTKKMEYKTRQWHEKCFCCVVCKNPIGTKSFIPREQEIYCAGCYEDKFATRCVKCNKIITSGGVTYKNEPWHRDCFTCSNCNNSLAGQRFTSRDDKPYCADCFGELFAKRCTACSKPITGIGGTRFISFEDRHWHNDCFICAGCKTSLVGRGFITDGDDIICPECAKQKLM